MHERLIENWLDSSSERAYQTPFCQMLVGKGHRIIHTTRHSPTEFGKDIISIAPGGQTHAFQLKGNPGSRLTLRQFREIQGQLQELVSYPVRGSKGKWHRSFLVTNGEIDEEAQDAISSFNAGNLRLGYPERKLEVISRGQLLSWAKSLGSALWPSELTDVNALLELMIYNGQSQPPIQKLHHILARSLRLNEDDRRFASQAEYGRHVTSTAILVSLATRSFQANQNHYAILSAWVLFCAYVIASAKRWGFEYASGGLSSVEVAKDAVFFALESLCSEVEGHDVLLSGDIRAEPFVYRVRMTLVCGLMSLYWFWCESEGWRVSSHRAAVDSLLNQGFKRHLLWGEGAIPQIIVHMWRNNERSKSAAADWSFASLLDSVVAANCSHDPDKNLASPYYDAEVVLRHQLKDIVGRSRDEIADDSFFGQSYFAEFLLHLLVRANAKRHCKMAWQDFSRLGVAEFQPAEEWRYCVWRADAGETIHRRQPSRKMWADLLNEARDCTGAGVPVELLNDKYLHFLFVMICPHRGTGSAMRYLARQFSSAWFIDEPIARQPPERRRKKVSQKPPVVDPERSRKRRR